MDISCEKKIKNILSAFSEKNSIDSLAIGILNKEEFDVFSNQSNKLQAFQIGSITKVITAFLVLKAKNSALLKEDQNIQFFFDFQMPSATGDITIREILNHESGFPRIPESIYEKMNQDIVNPYLPLKPSDIEYYLKNCDDLHGKIYEYSNFGYGLLGIILEKIYKLSYSEICQKFVFDPFEMKNSSVHVTNKNENILATPYNSKNEITEVWIDNVLSSAGMIICTVEDYLKFMKAHFTNNENSEIFKEMCKIQTKKMYTGYHRFKLLVRLLGANNYMWHNGMVGGFSSFSMLNIKKKKGLVIFCNKQISIDNLGLSLLGSF